MTKEKETLESGAPSKGLPFIKKKQGKSSEGPSKPEKTAGYGKVFVSSNYQKSGVPGREEVEEKTLEVTEFSVDPAWVKAGNGATVNLGNYESFRCDASVTLPCYPEESEIKAAMAEARRLAEEEIEEQVRGARGSR